MVSSWRSRGLAKCTVCGRLYPDEIIWCPIDNKKLRRRPAGIRAKHRFVNTNMGEKKSVDDMDSLPLVFVKVKR